MSVKVARPATAFSQSRDFECSSVCNIYCTSSSDKGLEQGSTLGAHLMLIFVKVKYWYSSGPIVSAPDETTRHLLTAALDEEYRNMNILSSCYTLTALHYNHECVEENMD